MTAEEQWINVKVKEALTHLRGRIKCLMKTVDATDEPEEISEAYFNNMALFTVLNIIDDYVEEVDK